MVNTNSSQFAGGAEGESEESAARIDWPLDADGIPHRQAARIVLLDAEDNTYLIRGHDFSDVNHWWWFTVGGGLEGTESLRQGAVRELWEETGLKVAPSQLEGPVLFRQAQFQFLKALARQDEHFFLYRVGGVRPTLRPGHLTDLEKDVLDEARWFSLEELRQQVESGQVVYPLEFPTYLRQWVKGWDGKCPQISEGTVGKRFN